jgi:hypothetical protein
MADNFFEHQNNKNIYKEDYQKGKSLLEQDTVQLYDKVAGLSNPIIFSAAISDESMRLSDNEMKENCRELLSIFAVMENEDSYVFDEDQWLKESIQLMRKAFVEAAKLIPENIQLYHELLEAKRKFDYLLSDQDDITAEVLVNVVPDEMQENFDTLDSEFVSFSVDELLRAPKEHIRVPRFQLRGITARLFLSSGEKLENVKIQDYSVNNLIITILKSVHDFMIDFEDEVDSTEDYAYYIRSYSEALNAHVTSYIVEDEKVFHDKYYLKINQSKTVDNLYKFIAEHILSKLPETFLAYHEKNPFSIEDNYITKLLEGYQSYLGGLCIETPPGLREQRNKIFPKGSEIWVELNPLKSFTSIPLFHYHFSLGLTENERDIFLNNKDSVMILQGNLLTDQFRPLDQLPVKVQNVQLEMFSDFMDS